MSTTILKIVVKPYTNKDLGKLFNMSSRTLRRNIVGIKETLGERRGHFWNIKQVEIIMAHIGRPYEIIESDSTEMKETA
jgi:hypothetical protein